MANVQKVYLMINRYVACVIRVKVRGGPKPPE